MSQDLKTFFYPSGVAIIGASSNPTKLSHGILRNLCSYGYKGEIYPVNPGSKEILGKKCYADIADVPDPVDLAVVILPSQTIPQVLRDIGKHVIGAVIIISGGFKEIGSEGIKLEQECVKITREYKMRLIGPNCVGTMNMVSGLNTTFIKGMPEKGGIGFLSQSGAVGGGVVDHILNKGVGFSHFLSLGNEADINETDIIEYLDKDDDTRVIAAYVESISDGQRFLRVCREVTQNKPVVLLKAGRTDSGAKAVSSHTGSLAGSQEAYSAAFKQAGIIEVNSVEELLNVSQILDQCPPPGGNRVAIITNAGGPAALASDKLDENGIQLSVLEQRTQIQLRKHLPSAAQVANPIDMLGGADASQYSIALSAVLADPNVDIALPILVPQALVDPAAVATSIVEESKRSNKPVIVCFMGHESVRSAFEILQKNRIPMMDYPEKLGKIVGSFYKYYKEIQCKPDFKIDEMKGINKVEVLNYFKKQNNKKVFGESETRPILQSYGIPLIAGGFAPDEKQAMKIADETGYPVALKVVSDEILHKSEFKGITLNIQNADELVREWHEMTADISQLKVGARINGFMIEKMAPKGQEVILGMKRDLNFGPLLMFGFGGIFVELFKDVSFRIAPLARNDAIEMINETKAGTLLTGFRGQEKADIEAIVDCLLRVSQLVLDFPRIQEVEINPLLVLRENEGAYGLDCRMIVD